MIEIAHNLEPRDFVWLWAKYVTGFNPKHHCTNSIRGRYSRKVSKHNKELTTSGAIVMDECQPDSYRAIYICGVAKQGYAKKTNYEHNLHAAICPQPGAFDTWLFEKWPCRSVAARSSIFQPAHRNFQPNTEIFHRSTLPVGSFDGQPATSRVATPVWLLNRNPTADRRCASATRSTIHCATASPTDFSPAAGRLPCGATRGRPVSRWLLQDWGSEASFQQAR